MVMVVKSEWHQVEKRYGLEVDMDLLEQIYPDSNKKEIKKIARYLYKSTKEKNSCSIKLVSGALGEVVADILSQGGEEGLFV